MDGTVLGAEPSERVTESPASLPDATLMREWRRRYRAAEWAFQGSQSGGRRRRLERLLARPFSAAADAAGLVQGTPAHRLAAGPLRVSRTGQFVRLWWLRAWYGIEGREYYRLRLYETGNRLRAYGVVREREVRRFLKLISNADPGHGRELLADKARTEAWCAANDLPVAASILTAENGQVSRGTPHAIPDVPLFSKLARSFGGSGACYWERVAAGRWASSEDPGAAPVDRGGLVAALGAQSLESSMPVLLQLALVNHPDVAGLTTGALATVRFVTLRTRSDEVLQVSATYRIPTGDAVIDAFSHGGLAAPVDLATGRLAAATTIDLASVGETATVHPDTGAQIEGAILPDWGATVDLVLRAHSAVPGSVPLIGWDVALTAAGPVLLEGNVPPSTALMQVPTRTPLGETPVVAVILDYVRAIELR